MARGDGGKNVFDTDKDRFSWTDLMERAAGRFGWRVHAWVLMGNHFHVLLETPEPNLVTGMKWVLGVYSQSWNRRRQRHGHVFQGRYKAVVVNGEECDGSYFKIVADYIHLNPVRSGWVGGATGKSLRSWRWGSFAAYADGRIPVWLETERVLRAFQLSADARGGKAYGAYLEARAKDRKGVISDVALTALRRGWYLGEKSFAAKILKSISSVVEPKRKKGSIGGPAAKSHDEAQAEKIVVAALSDMNLPGTPADLTGRGKWKIERDLIAALVRKHTAMANAWVAARLGMGHEVNVTRALRRVRQDRAMAMRLLALEAKLAI
jgi:REP element-mobilizing transposase RayT